MSTEPTHGESESQLDGCGNPLVMIESSIKSSIEGFKSSRSFYRRGSLVQTILAAALGAFTTLLIAVNQLYHQVWITALSLTAAALMTVTGAWGSWFSFKRLWVSNQTTLNRLYSLRDRINFEKINQRGQLSPEQLKNYFNELQDILDKANTDWSKVRESHE